MIQLHLTMHAYSGNAHQSTSQDPAEIDYEAYSVEMTIGWDQCPTFAVPSRLNKMFGDCTAWHVCRSDKHMRVAAAGLIASALHNKQGHAACAMAGLISTV